MNLKSGMPLWLIKDGLPHTFPKLDKNIETDVLILGAGISGALVRYYLLKAGVDCTTIDARTIGLGSTSASTSLLQYEIDTPLHKLIDMVGKKNAERAYQLCGEAILTLKEIAKDLEIKDFCLRKSLFFAAYKKDVSMLEKEFKARKEAGFDVEFLTEKDIEKQFNIKAPAAILSSLAAETNAYAFSHKLLQYNGESKHANIFDRSPVVDIKTKHSGIDAKTENGFTIKAKKIVYATGYEVVDFIDKKVVDLLSTYAVVSEQFNERKFWKDDVLIWNTADPYLYLRTTPDNRILIGGRDEDFQNPKKRDALLEKKAEGLVNDFKKLFPDIPFKKEFSWTGTFGATKDGLPYIGSYKPLPNSYFALGFGGNGITFSTIAAEMIRNEILGKSNPDAPLFSFER
ncbi:FAD-dependent oxidoreductase [Flavobacterium sp. NST-5]|uniref:FAD-dependent oxidoreductase n=1 Tax=Flavobacterium ichthyis TaxID=2698827 RepID=A0ABW9ZAC1_9FLAO|nr:FAD-binding oxidoreductase [Flavobacterium ichthyis]NBL65841.1 FAD-dependent oxidoreductase [Flavobacterium ichthyis]